MKPPRSNFFAAASWAVCCCISATNAYAQSAPSTNLSLVTPAKPTPSLQTGAKDEANQSPRERGRILVKRNPIASEYQIFGDNGTSPGADADGEGVDYRAFFPSSNPTDNPKDSLRASYTLNYNDQSSKSKSGYSLGFNKVLDPENKWALAAQLRSSASDRKIEHYESVWQSYLDRPRISIDEIHTRNNVLTAQLAYRPNDQHTFYAKTYYQDYFDYSYRNRLELQFGSANLQSGSETISQDGSVTAATFTNAKTRRYFGDTENERTRQHHTLGGTYTGEEWTVDYSLYSQKWDLGTQWYDWNFRESGLNVSYALDNPYLPTLTENDGTNLLDISEADFSSLRIHQSSTRDRDVAARIDADRSIFLGDKEIWIQTGFLHREKERNSDKTIDVHLPDPSANFTLAEVAYDTTGTEILGGAYTLPAGLDPMKAREFVASQPQYFPLDAYRSKIETAPQSYSASESVTAAYFLGTRKMERLTVEVGGRFEHTQTETRGTVVIPDAVNDPSEGTLLETVTNPSDSSTLVIKDLYSKNDYDNFIPSAEASFQATPNSTIKAAWFQLLMRPQYFNIVDYRRISVPTRNISEGNPNLSPTSIDKFRLAWTKENEQIGTFSAELYLIQIENFFYGSVSEETILEQGTPETYRVSRVENGEDASIKGFELQWKKSASDFGFLDKATVTAAYTFSDSEASVSSRPNDILPTPERSDHLFKVSFTGTVKDFSSTLDLTYQSEALDDLGTSYEQDEYREPVVNLSLQNQYKIDDNTTLSLGLFNLTNHPERSYEGSPLRVTRNQYSSWFSTLRLSRNF